MAKKAEKLPEITVACRKAVEKVISQQSSPHWSAQAHFAALVYLSTLCGSPKDYAAELIKNPFLAYASNTKKVLEALGMIPESASLSEYGFED